MRKLKKLRNIRIWSWECLCRQNRKWFWWKCTWRQCRNWRSWWEWEVKWNPRKWGRNRTNCWTSCSSGCFCYCSNWKFTNRSFITIRNYCKTGKPWFSEVEYFETSIWAIFYPQTKKSFLQAHVRVKTLCINYKPLGGGKILHFAAFGTERMV